MTDLKSNITKGLIAAVCSVLAITVGVISARHEGRQAAAASAFPNDR